MWAETVKLGISARRNCVSSVVGITLSIREGYFVRSAFPGFPAEGLAFFAGLQRNNNREWFQPRKAIFDETVKQPMRELVSAVNSAMKSFAPDYVTDPGQGDLPHLSRHPLQQGQDAVQGPHCGLVFAARGQGGRGVLLRGFAQGGGDRRRHLRAASRKRCSPSGSTWRSGTRNSARSPGRARFASFSARCRASS